MRKSALTAVLLLILQGDALAAENGAKLVDDTLVKAFLAGDVEAVMALYAPDATLYPPGAPTEAKGSAEIRTVMADFLRQFTVREFRIVDSAYETAGSLSVG
jgi:ketosteroid isomerase-like protein